jgi:WD40 repeat protein
MGTRRAIVAALAVCALAAGCWNSQAPDSGGCDGDSNAPLRAVYGLTVSYGEDCLAYYGTGKAIHLQSLPSRKPAGRLCFRNCEVQSACFHPSEMALLACYVDGSVVRWTRLDESWRPQVLGRLRNDLLCSAVSPEGDRFVVGSASGIVTVWSLGRNPRVIKRLQHSHSIWSLRFSPDGGELAVSGNDAMLKKWDTETWSETDVETGHRGVISVTDYSSDGRLFATAGYDGTLRMFDRDSGRPLWTANISDCGIRTVGFSPDGRVLAVGTVFSGKVQLRDAASGRLLRSIPAHGTTVTRARFLMDGTLLTSSHDGAVEAFVVLPELRPR